MQLQKVIFNILKVMFAAISRCDLHSRDNHKCPKIEKSWIKHCKLKYGKLKYRMGKNIFYNYYTYIYIYTIHNYYIYYTNLSKNKNKKFQTRNKIGLWHTVFIIFF